MPRIARDRTRNQGSAGRDRRLARARGEIEFDDVVFGYDPGASGAQGRELRAAAGETIAIVGPSGAGKTTMASLLARFYEPQQGAIQIDGRDTRDLTLDRCDGNIAMVLQPPLVLGDTMRANIALGRARRDERQIESAAKMPPASSRFSPSCRPDLDEVVGQGGHSLSEGEAQRVTIARASAQGRADSDHGRADQRARYRNRIAGAGRRARAAMRGRTTLVIAHRLSTIQNADRILVLRDGVIAEQGTFDELLSRGGFFSYLYNLQAWDKQAAGG